MKKVQDHYFKRAKREGYPARSVYKLEEAQRKHRFLSRGKRVLDLGAFPGSWTRYASRTVGPEGLVVAVDIQELHAPGGNVVTVHGDAMEVSVDDLRRISSGYDVVLSDMAPRTTGRKDVDHLRSIALAERAFSLAIELLVPRGVFFCKVFQGEAFSDFLRMCKGHFTSAKVVKPKSSRSESVETFVLCSRGEEDATVK